MWDPRFLLPDAVSLCAAIGASEGFSGYPWNEIELMGMPRGGQGSAPTLSEARDACEAPGGARSHALRIDAALAALSRALVPRAVTCEA